MTNWNEMERNALFERIDSMRNIFGDHEGKPYEDKRTTKERYENGEIPELQKYIDFQKEVMNK